MLATEFNKASEFNEVDQSPPSQKLRVVEVDFRNDRRWLDYLLTHRDALVYHHPGWITALEAEYGRKCIALACEGEDGQLQGVLPLLPTRGFPLRWARNQVRKRLSSLPRTPLAGPLASSEAALVALVRAAIERVKNGPGFQLELKTMIPNLADLVPELQRIEWRGTYVRGLPTNDEPERDLIGDQSRTPRASGKLSFGSSRQNHQVKWAVNKAKKQGVFMRPASGKSELKRWYELYLILMQRHAVPPRPLRFFERLWDELQPLGLMELAIADLGGPDVYEDETDSTRPPANAAAGTMVSGSIQVQFGHTSFWAFTGSTEDSTRLHVNDLTLWYGMHESCRQGYDWFDLGEVAENHPELMQFKAKWGTIIKPMYRYYYPPLPVSEEEEKNAPEPWLSRMVASVWRKLPLPIVAALGDWILSYL